MNRALGWTLLLTLASGVSACGTDAASAPSVEAPAMEAPNEAPPEEPAEALPPRAWLDELENAGPLVRLGELNVPAGQRAHVAADACTEVFVRVVEGALEGHEASATLLARAPFEVRAATDSRIVVAAVRPEDAPFGAECTRVETTTLTALPAPEVLPFAGGKLRVRIFVDEGMGARFGAFSSLDGDADLPVPPHVHEGSVESLRIVEGDGSMLQGEDESPIGPGRVLYVPPNVRHGYTPGTTKLVAYQVYAPGGPEQRFRTPPPAPAFAPRP